VKKNNGARANTIINKSTYKCVSVGRQAGRQVGEAGRLLIIKCVTRSDSNSSPGPMPFQSSLVPRSSFIAALTSDAREREARQRQQMEA
jgi:hypothetical protein